MWNARPVCPKYFSGQSRYFIWYMPLFPYLFVCVGSFTMFCIVFRVLNAIFIPVSLKSFVTFLVSFPLYVQVAHFVFWCCGSLFLILCFLCFVSRFMLYLLLCSAFLWCLIPLF
jgi:hypothetical protein